MLGAKPSLEVAYGGSVVTQQHYGASRRSLAGQRQSLMAQVRREVARELHDSVVQTLTAMLVDIEQFKTDQHGRQGVLNWADGYQNLTREALGSVRQMLYVLRNEHDGHDLIARVGALVIRTRKHCPMEVRLRVGRGWPDYLPPAVNHNLYRIVQEGLTNAIRHSGATHVTISMLGSAVLGLSVLVTDNGRGIGAAGDHTESMGLRGVRERCLEIGATVRLRPASPTGTRLQVHLARLP